MNIIFHLNIKTKNKESNFIFCVLIKFYNININNIFILVRI